MRCCCRSTWTCILISDGRHLDWRLLLLDYNSCILSCLRSHGVQWLLLPSPGYSVGIWLRQVYLQEALYHLCSPCPLLFLRDIVCFLSFFSAKPFAGITSIDVWSRLSSQIIKKYGAYVCPPSSPKTMSKKIVCPSGKRTFTFVFL